MGATPSLNALEKKEVSGRLTELESEASWNILLEGRLKIWNT